MKNRSGHTVDEVAGREKSLIPKTKRERRVRKKGQTSLYQVTVFALGNTILLRRVWTRHTMRDASALKVPMEFVILTTLIRLNCLNFKTQEAFHMSLKSIEDLLDIRLMFKQINPAETSVVIHKANIIFVPSRRCNSWTPNI